MPALSGGLFGTMSIAWRLDRAGMSKRLAAMRRLLSQAKGFVPKHERELHEAIRAALAQGDE